jgi:hypothetical protein
MLRRRVDAEEGEYDEVKGLGLIWLWTFSTSAMTSLGVMTRQPFMLVVHKEVVKKYKTVSQDAFTLTPTVRNRGAAGFTRSLGVNYKSITSTKE